MTEKFICDGIGSRELVQNHIENTDLWRSVLWWQLKSLEFEKHVLTAYYMPIMCQKLCLVVILT